MISDFLGDYFTFDSKIFKSLWYLAAHPGYLTTEYNSGRRVNYIPPLRLLILLGVVFFLLSGIFSTYKSMAGYEEGQSIPLSLDLPVDGDDEENDEVISIVDTEVDEQLEEADSLLSTIEEGDSLTVNDESLEEESDTTDWGQLDRLVNRASWEALAMMTQDSVHNYTEEEIMDSLKFNSKFESHLARQAIKFVDKKGSQITNYMFNNLTLYIIVMIPILAFIMKILYIRRKVYYLEHFIFSAHLHSFLYLLFLLVLIFFQKFEPENIWWIMPVITVYTFFALRKVYSQSIKKTVSKMFLLWMGYMMAVSFGLILALISAFIFF